MEEQTTVERENIGRIDVAQYASGTEVPEVILYRQIIIDALNVYIYFGLSGNCSDPDEFVSAYNYLFRVNIAYLIFVEGLNGFG